MSCCGKARAAAGYPDVNVTPYENQPSRREVAFENIGRTGLTVRGPITGAVYRFAKPGSKVFVSAKDSSALQAVPNLRRLA